MAISPVQLSRLSNCPFEFYSLERCITPQDNDADPVLYNAKSSQSEYVLNCAKICRSLCDLLSQRFVPFEEILIWLGNQRRANAKGSKDEHSFGVSRSYGIEGKVSTPIIGQYASLLENLCGIAEDDPTMEWELYDSNPDAYNMGYRLGIDSKGHVIRLSKYCFIRSPGNLKGAIAHTNQEYLKSALEQCAHLYAEILRLDDISEIKLKIAELHWWMVQACPYKRGTASCTEILIAALSEYKKICLTPYKKGVFPDRIALVEPMERFVQLYSSLRE